MKKIPLYCAALTMLCAPLSARSEGVALGLSGGTLGAGLEGIFGINSYLNARIGYHGYSYQANKTLDDIKYDVDLKLRNFGLMIDWHPFGGVFRLTGGILNNRNSFDFTRALTLGQVINDPPIPPIPPVPDPSLPPLPIPPVPDPSLPIPPVPDPTLPIPPVSQLLPIGDLLFNELEVGTLSGRVSIKRNVPYLGFGWANSLGRGSRFGISFDIGVVFQGSPDVELSASGILAGNPIFENELAKEEQKIQDDLKKYKYYPAISLGVSYRF